MLFEIGRCLLHQSLGAEQALPMSGVVRVSATLRFTGLSIRSRSLGERCTERRELCAKHFLGTSEPIAADTALVRPRPLLGMAMEEHIAIASNIYPVDRTPQNFLGGT